MRKADLIRKIREKSGLETVDILVIIEAFFSEVKTNLIRGEAVYIRGFGSFILKKRAFKIGRNVKLNTVVEIPEHFIPQFKPAKEFMNEVKNAQHGLEADVEE